MIIAPNTTITQAGYHYILDTIRTVLSTSTTGYGIVSVSDYIGTGTLISTKPWENLYNDLNKAYVHQTGISLDYPSNTFPTPGSVLSRSFVNTLTEAADSVAVNKYTVAANQLASVTTGSVSGTSTFTSVLTNTVFLEWSDEQSIDWYFNLGGKIVTNLTAPVPATTDTEHLLVVDLINNFTSTIAVPFDRTLWLATKTAPGRIYTTNSTASTSTGPFTAYFTVSNTYQILDGDYSTTSTIKVNTEIIPTTVEELVPLFNLTATVTVTNYFSTGSIVAIRPELTQTRDFDDFVTSPNVRRTRTLTPSLSNLYYTMLGGSTSSVQTIEITNTNIDPTSSVATITGITISSDVVTPYLSHSALPITLPVGSTATLSLYWDKPTISAKELGEHYNSIVIQSNNTKGDLVLPVRVLVNEPPGDWDFSPASHTETLTTYKQLIKNIRIVPEFSTVRRIVSYNLAQGSGVNFSILKTPSTVDPTVVIAYEPFKTDTGTYTGTFTVTVEIADTTGDYIQITKSFVFTVNQNIVDSNLGTWISPVGAVNSVIGASYDIIDGERYLTIGVGVGADGSPTVDEGGGSDLYANVNYLGVSSDTISSLRYKFKSYFAVTMLPIPGPFGFFGGRGEIAPNPDVFLSTYGIVSSQAYIGPDDTQCTFNVDIPTSGNYTIKYSVYETGYVEIDGNKIINLSAYDLNNYQSTTSAIVNLTAGTHTIRFVGNLCIALTVVDQTDNLIWSTLNAVQSLFYKNWWEVYRFPINMDGQNKTMDSKLYRVKDTATLKSTAESKLFPYGDFFGYSATDYGSMFRIRSNGKGDITILMVPPIQPGKIGDTVTVGSLFFAFYYNQLSIPRYTHKTGGQYDGDPTYTDYFVGFNKYGAVKTSKVAIPRGFKYNTSNNSVLDSLITFFLSSLITDYIIINLGLFQATYYLAGGTLVLTQNVSFGIYMLSKLGVNVGTSQTIAQYIVQYFTSFFQPAGGFFGGSQAGAVLAQWFPAAQSAGTAGAITAGEIAYLGMDLGYSALIPADTAIVTSVEYMGAAAADVNAALYLQELTATPAGAFVVGAVGVVLAVAGINYFIKGLREGDIGKVVVGGASAAVGLYIIFSTGLFCFKGDTKIKLADGTCKRIADFTGGELVFNHDCSSINCVRFVIENPNYIGPLYGINESTPFVSYNHPLIIHGELSSFDPEYVHNNYPWLGNCKKIEPISSQMTNTGPVYNLLVDGDGTYTVNDYGASSVLGSGGVLIECVDKGLISKEQAFKVLEKLNSLGGKNLHDFYNIIHTKEYDDVTLKVFAKVINLI